MQTQLFNSNRPRPFLNVLSRDGRVDYHPVFFDHHTSAALFQTLMNSLDWQVDQIMMFGKRITTKRKVVWVGDPECAYTYSGVKKSPKPWTPELHSIKEKLETVAQWRFNSCLLNLYHDGSEGMGWHSDDEKELVETAPIASLSLGGERKFTFKHKTDKTNASLVLAHGSVLIMHAPTQAFWQHSLVKTKLSVAPRINLTFRAIRTPR